MNDDNYVGQCTCDVEYIEEHTCPFSEDVNNDSESLCTCCAYCIEQCSNDI